MLSSALSNGRLAEESSVWIGWSYAVHALSVADTSPVEEVAPKALSVAEAVEVIASKKALAVSAKHPEAYVLAADTVVVLGDELIDKARDAATLRAQLAMLAGGTDEAVAWGGRAIGLAESRVVLGVAVSGASSSAG